MFARRTKEADVRKFLDPRRSRGTLIALVALLVALGGTAVAAGGLTGKQKKQVTTIAKKVFNSKIGGASVAHAGTATSADRATTADSATNAGTATNANQLGGAPASSYAQQSSLATPAFTPASGVVDTPLANNCAAAGSPNAWADRSDNVNFIVGYTRDVTGFVHLQGSAWRCGTAGSTVFTLPAGFRPTKLAHVSAVMEDSTPDTGQVMVGGNGDVSAPDVAVNKSISLDGITFRCGPSGSNGCP